MDPENGRQQSIATIRVLPILAGRPLLPRRSAGRFQTKHPERFTDVGTDWNEKGSDGKMDQLCVIALSVDGRSRVSSGVEPENDRLCRMAKLLAQ